MQVSVKVTQNDLGALVPSHLGEGMVNIVVNHMSSPKSVTISYAGMIQAMASFDDFGTRVINYTLVNPMASMVDQMSIENIIEHMNINMLG